MLSSFPLLFAPYHFYPSFRYFVTELLETDLHHLLTLRLLEKQVIQYFLYQILVSATSIRCLPAQIDNVI